MAAKNKGATKKKLLSKNKKEAQLLVRLDAKMRERFIDICQELDTTASREVRRFIKRYLARYDKGELDD